MNKNAPYEHENVEGLDKLVNLEMCIDVEKPLKQSKQSNLKVKAAQETFTVKNIILINHLIHHIILGKI
jgi:hypothetical protein